MQLKLGSGGCQGAHVPSAPGRAARRTVSPEVVRKRQRWCEHNAMKRRETAEQAACAVLSWQWPPCINVIYFKSLKISPETPMERGQSDA